MKLDLAISSHKPVPHGGLYSIPNPQPDMLDFSSNVNPLGPSPKVLKTIKNQLNTIKIYPDSDSFNLRKDLQDYTKIPSSQIVVGNGATEIIYNFCKAFLTKKRPVLIPVPTFGEYEAASKLAGANVEFYKTMDLKKDIDNFILKLPHNGCIFICNPNNPTGHLLSKKFLRKIILAANKKNTLVFVDECFIELVPDYNESIITLVKKFNNLFVLRSLTKSFGLAGIRIGYGIGTKKLISILNQIKIPWNVSGLAQHAASAAISTPNYLDKTKKVIHSELIYLKNNISKLENFDCFDSVTNFILIKTKLNSSQLQQKLLNKKILIRDCSNFRGLNHNYIRVAVKTRKENQKLVMALENL
ncbi:MAG TPA: threonine-phosphate decarboxylase CobD [Nitrosopumilaceae archaeon]|nr:threonine-phosphate decarboxylase CobD [Nitrosopumilaceae archaeon]